MTEPAATTGPHDPDGPAPEGRLLLVGARRQIRRLAHCLDQGPWGGLPIVGFVDVTGRGRQLVVHSRSDPVPMLGRVEHLAELVGRSRATDLVVALSGRPARRLRPALADLSSASVRVHWVGEDAPHLDAPRHRLRRVIRVERPWSWQRVAKRAVDVLGATVGLVLLTPLFLVVSALILLTSGWPIFYTQERVGQGGRLFRIIKFRSMRKDAESATGPVWAYDHDERCTRVGDWLRHTNIDELPQLFNVLRGELSLVGPRPERPVFVERFRGELPDYDLRHAVPMGMTGWAQVHGFRGRTSLRKRLQYDLDYIGRWSFWLDLMILVMTVQHVAVGKTRWTGGAPTRGPRP